MTIPPTAIATITWARNRDEEGLLLTAISELTTFGLPLFVTDGGSSGEFIRQLQSMPQVQVSQSKGLWPQAKNSLTEAVRSGAETILYTEPDKLAFFRDHLPQLLATKRAENTGVVLASRSPNALATFPPFQQMTETAINNCCAEVTGQATDYCYGPFLFSSSLLSSLDPLPDNCGWGWRPFLFVTAHRLGLAIDVFQGDLVCPPEQRADDATERVYRMKQLSQNIDGIVLAASQEVG